MTPSKVLSALFKFRNIMTLLIWFCGGFLLQSISYPFQARGITINSHVGTGFYLLGISLYLVLTMQSCLSKSFNESWNEKQRIRQIKQLDKICYKLAVKAKDSLKASAVQKLRKVIEDKNEIVEAFFRDEKNYLKEKIVDKSINLVIGYIKLLNNFSIRTRELESLDLTEVANRVNSNKRKMAFIKDLQSAEDVKNIIAMDEKIISSLKNEKVELERISTKLDYIESMVNMFKHQIISSIESEEMINKLEEALNEATALDNVLDERKRNKMSY